MLKLMSLHEFELPVWDDTATVSMIDNKPMNYNVNSLSNAMKTSVEPFNKYLGDYPVVKITSDMLATRESARTIGAGNLFLPVEDSILKKLVSTWREKGVLEAIQTAALEDPTKINKIVHWVATKISNAVDFIERKTCSYEGLSSSIHSGLIPEIVTTRDWTSSLIHCLAWHPHCIRLALATRDDRIRIYSNGIQGVAVLRHSSQKSVSCMSWRPNGGRELAAACQSGILIWTIELGAASNSLSHAILLRQRNHAPVCGVAWNPHGDLLVSCSPNDLNIIVWDVSKEMGVPLKRVGGGGQCFIKWSPCGAKLFAATCRNVFRVWNTGTGKPWTAERWISNGRIAAACFGPHQTLLFASTDESPILFSLPLQNNIFDVKQTISTDDKKIAIPLIDLSKVYFKINENDDDDDDGESVSIGGRIVAMDWDPSGKYLAILFHDSHMVAIFNTNVGNVSRLTEITPGCLVKGFPGEIPNCLQFHQYVEISQIKACLSIAWSSGRVQHFPIIES